MTLILVERLDTFTGQLKTQPLCSVWVGIQMPPLQKFGNYIYVVLASNTGTASAKQTWHWTIPKQHSRTM